MIAKKNSLLLFVLCFTISIHSSGQNKYIDSIKNVIATTKLDTVKARALTDLSEELTYIDQDNALKYAKESIELSKKIKFRNGIRGAYTRLGILYTLIDKEDSALYFLELAKIIAIKDKYIPGLSAIENNIGMAQFNKNEYDKSLASYFSSLKHAEEVKDTTLITSILNNIANLYSTISQLEKSLEYHTKSLKLARKLNSKFKIASSLNNIGIIYRQNKNYAEAIKAFDESLTLAKEMGNKYGISLLMNNIGAVYQDTKQYEVALQFYNEALVIKKEIKDKRGEANSYQSIGEVYLAKFQYDKAIENCLNAVKLASEIKNKGIINNAYKVISESYAAKKQFEKAFTYYKLYTSYKDSVFNLEKSEQIEEMSAKYETEKKDKEIALLNADKALQDATIAKQNADAEKQSAVRTAMLIVLLLIALLAVFIFRSNRIKNKANKELSEKNNLIENQKQVLQVKQKEIVDSIQYAKRIQDALLTHTDIIKSYVPEHFIFFKPKDIISGDFYWAASVKTSAADSSHELFYLAVCDSTGHGVPGAFMSLLNINFLNEAIIEKKIEEPGKIFDYVRERLIASISKEEQKDGFDGILLCYNKTTNQLRYSAANNKPLLIHNSSLVEMSASRMPVGKGERTDNFETFTTNIAKGDHIYLYSDGYGDQFGGPKGKKFKHKQLNQLILKNHHLPMNQQSELLNETFSAWKGGLEQVDDVCVMGLRF